MMCPFGQTNEEKYNQACKAGKIGRNNGGDGSNGGTANLDLEVMAGLVKAHYISVPMLATCCGVSACYDCIRDVISDQLRR